MNISRAICEAFDSYSAKNFSQAEYLYKRILKRQPDNIDALHMLGVIYFELKQYDLAGKYIKKELQLSPNNANAYINIGLVFQGKGELDEAVASFRKALQFNPTLDKAYYNLGNTLKEKRMFDEAVACYRKALQFNPNLEHIHNNLGVVLKEKGSFDEAIACFHKARQLNPNSANIYYNLGLCFQENGLLDEAINYYLKALQFEPKQLTLNYADAYNHLGMVLYLKHRCEEAVEYYKKALQLDPDNIDIYNKMGTAYHKKGYIDEAIACYQKALQLDPGYADAYINMGNAFKDRGQLKEAEANYKLALRIKPNPYAYDNILLAMNYDPQNDAQVVLKEHLEFGIQFAAPLASAVLQHKNDCEPDRILRLGYVSPDFRRHSVAYFIEPVLKAHHRKHFEIFCYSDVSSPDNVTKCIQEYADQWKNIVGISDEKASELIRNDRIDILIDLAGHTGNNRMLLFARKPAPVQVNWIGYPATTGLRVMDYKIVDHYTDPPGMTEQFYAEKLMRMPESFLCYLPEKDSPEVGDLPALQTGRITFGSFNYFTKISPGVVAVWTDILKKISGSRLIMKSKNFANETTRCYALDMFCKEGIEVDRIELLSFEPSTKGHLGVYNRIDIGLDTFPYNGTTTTCEAMWMGVPVITLAGNTHASRVGVSILSNAGLKELVAETYEEYLDIAVNLSSDLERLQLLRGRLRAMMAHSPLTDAKQFTANLEICYREMWKDWCTRLKQYE